MSYRLFLDDEREPPAGQESSWVIARSSTEAIEMVKARGMPHFVSFDHDLGGPDKAVIFVNWLIDPALDAIEAGCAKPEVAFPREYYVHSQNPEGAANIRGKMEGFLKYLREP